MPYYISSTTSTATDIGTISATTNGTILWSDSTSNTTTPSLIWTSPSSTISGINTHWGPPREVTPAERVQLAESRLRWEQEARVRQKAKERAALLLQENLSEKQRLELAAKGYFTLVVASNGEKRYYQVHQGRNGNVHQVDAHGNKIGQYCAHPRISCPDEDTMLAQKLMLESQEQEFLRIANRWN